MFRFEDSIYLWLLLIIPVLVVISYISWRQKSKKLKKFGDTELLKSLMPDVSKYRPIVKLLLLLVALSLLIMMLARPQMGTNISHEKRNGIQIMIALDISNSMMSEDVTPSRLDKSKLLVENLVDNFSNDKIGLVVFAGDAFIQLPITNDYVSAKMFLQNTDPSLIATQGTDIANAIKISMNSFSQQDKMGKAIIVITDGEDHEGGAVNAAREVRKKGIKVFILGVGSTKGAPILLENGNYLKDNTGQTVMTALNEQMCQEIAKAGKGAYIHVDNTNDAQKKLGNELTKLQKGDTENVVFSDYDEQFQAFGILVIILLIIEICIMESKNKLFRNIQLFKKREIKKFIILFVLIFFCISVNAQADRQYIRSGNKLFRAQKYAKAEVDYRKAVSVNGNNSQAYYNLGCALMMQNKDSAAVVQYENAGKMETNKLRKAKSYHNMGVICQNRKMYSEAIEAYKESLRNNPSDNETRYNLALCKRMEKKKDSKKQEKPKSKKDKDREKQNKPEQNKDKQQKSPQSKNDMSKDNAEQLLNAAMQEEKKTQQRLNKAMQQPKRRQLQKDW